MCRSKHLSTSTQPKSTLQLSLLMPARLLCLPSAFWLLSVSASPGLSASLSQSTRKQEFAKSHLPTEALCVYAFVVSGGRDPCPGWLQSCVVQEATTRLAFSERDGWREGAASWGAAVTFASCFSEG